MKDYRHGIAVEFIKKKQCLHCKKMIINQPALYTFLYRATPAGQSGAYHLSCVRKMRPAIGSGRCRMSKKDFTKKLHYTFEMQSSYVGTVKVLPSYVQKLLKLSITNQYGECLKSPNQGSINAAIINMSNAVRKTLGVEKTHKKLSGILAKKEVRAKVPFPTWKEIETVLDNRTPKIVSSHFNFIRLEYSIRIRGYPIKFALNKYKRPVLGHDSWVDTSNAYEYNFSKYCESRRLRSKMSKLALLASLGLEKEVNIDLLLSKNLDDKILQLVIAKALHLKKKDTPLTKQSLSILLFDANKTVRRLAESKWKKLHKQEQKTLIIIPQTTNKVT